MYVTLGCKLNFAETSTVARILADRGIRRAQAGETPDLCVVNTCSVTELADKKGRQAIRSLAKRFPGATIIATGCYAQLKPDEVASIEGWISWPVSTPSCVSESFSTSGRRRISRRP